MGRGNSVDFKLWYHYHSIPSTLPRPGNCACSQTTYWKRKWIYTVPHIVLCSPHTSISHAASLTTNTMPLIIDLINFIFKIRLEVTFFQCVPHSPSPSCSQGSHASWEAPQHNKNSTGRQGTKPTSAVCWGHTFSDTPPQVFLPHHCEGLFPAAFPLLKLNHERVFTQLKWLIRCCLDYRNPWCALSLRLTLTRVM